MKCRLARISPEVSDASLVVLGAFLDEFPCGAACAVDQHTSGALARAAKPQGFTGKVGETMLYFPDGSVRAEQVLVYGLGPRDEFNLTALRKGLTAAFKSIKRLDVPRVDVAEVSLGDTGITPYMFAWTVAEYAGMLDYVINHQKTKVGGHKKEKRVGRLRVLSVDNNADVQAGLKAGRAVARAVNFCRDLGNTPAGNLTPLKLAKAAKRVAAESRGKIKCRVLREKDLEELGAGALLAVSYGSAQEPVLIELTYTPVSGATDEVLGLVGKSVTFDSGGLDLKPSAGMLTMKRDMAGGATVLAALSAIAALDTKLSVKAILAATENMPGNRPNSDKGAFKPGDVVISLSGKSIEIGNTDAEGRLTLADGIEYARRQGVTCIVDIATLTGAVRSFGGDVGAGLFGNDREFSDLVLAAAECAGERLGELPMWEEFREGNDSDMADLKNTGGDPGATTAAWFLREFAGEDIPWVHLDIAGPSYRTRELGPDPKGCTGYGVRTTVAIAASLASVK